MTKFLNLPQSGWVREPTVLAVVPWGRTKLRQEIAAGRFPAPRHFSQRVIAWDAQAVHAWIEQQRQSVQPSQAPRDCGQQPDAEPARPAAELAEAIATMPRQAAAGSEPAAPQRARIDSMKARGVST